MKTKTAKVKTTGTYLERSKELVAALEFALTGNLSANVLYEIRGEDPKKPAYWWDFPNHVSVEVTRSSGADPRIWVFRRDPIDPSRGEDWKNEWFERSYQDKLYHVGAIAQYVHEQMEYNRKKLVEHNANAQKFNEDMQGTLIPTDVSIERNPKTGRYELHMTAKIKELGRHELKFVVAKCRDFKQAVEPFEKKGHGPDA